MLDCGLHLNISRGEDRIKVTDSRPVNVDCCLMCRVLMMSLVLEARARACSKSCLMEFNICDAQLYCALALSGILHHFALVTSLQHQIIASISLCDCVDHFYFEIFDWLSGDVTDNFER